MTWTDRLATLRKPNLPISDSCDSSDSLGRAPTGPVGPIGTGVFRQNQPPEPPSVPPVPVVRDTGGTGGTPANDLAPVPVDAAGPTAPCAQCGGGGWWRTSGFPTGGAPGPWCCSTCSPPLTDEWQDACAVRGGPVPSCQAPRPRHARG